MSQFKKTTFITVQDVPVATMSVDQCDYIDLTDIMKTRIDAIRAVDVIKNWLCARSTLEFLRTWEVMYGQGVKETCGCTSDLEVKKRSGNAGQKSIIERTKSCYNKSHNNRIAFK